MSPTHPTAHPAHPKSLAADLSAGLSVALLALPLCLAIAKASGFPPVMGVVSAIIGGIVGSLIGSAPLTIKGPAAGLIVIVIGAVTELGYEKTLAVGVVAAVLQILFALLKAGRFALMMPPSVIHGMMAAIGVIIISKQLPVALGVSIEKMSPLMALWSAPDMLMRSHPIATLSAGLTVIILILAPKLPRALRKLPPPLYALSVAIPLSIYFDLAHTHDVVFLGSTAQVSEALLVDIPKSVLNAVTFPDFSEITSGVSVKYIIMFSLIGAVESLLSALAVDELDPAKHASNLNKDLLSVGVVNLITASVGALPVISEIVRSKANIDAGAQSPRSNFTHGVALLIFVMVLPGVLHLIPLSALAAMLLMVGYRLANPKELAHMYHLGLDQLVLFLVTCVVTLLTDLLVGVAVGIALKVVFHLARGVSVSALFGSRVERHEEGDALRLTVKGSLTFMATLSLIEALEGVAESRYTRVVLDLEGVRVIDHTALSRLYGAAAEWPHTSLEVMGFEAMRSAGGHERSARVRSAS